MFPGYEELFLAPLKLERIPGIGKKGLPRFHSLGYKKIGDLACSTKAELCQHFGRWGGQLHQVASGKPSEIYRYVPESPSRSHERTFSQDLRDPERIRSELRHLVEKLCFKLRQEHLKSQSISVKIRDGNFNTVNRSQTFDHPVDADKIIFKAAHDLVMRNLPGQNGIRLLGVSAHQLTSTTTQLNLFQPPCDKLEQFYQAVDTIKIKYGRQAAGFGL